MIDSAAWVLGIGQGRTVQGTVYKCRGPQCGNAAKRPVARQEQARHTEPRGSRWERAAPRRFENRAHCPHGGLQEETVRQKALYNNNDTMNNKRDTDEYAEGDCGGNRLDKREDAADREQDSKKSEPAPAACAGGF